MIFLKPLRTAAKGQLPVRSRSVPGSFESPVQQQDSFTTPNSHDQVLALGDEGVVKLAPRPDLLQPPVRRSYSDYPARYGYYWDNYHKQFIESPVEQPDSVTTPNSHDQGLHKYQNTKYDLPQLPVRSRSTGSRPLEYLPSADSFESHSQQGSVGAANSHDGQPFDWYDISTPDADSFRSAISRQEEEQALMQEKRLDRLAEQLRVQEENLARMEQQVRWDNMHALSEEEERLVDRARQAFLAEEARRKEEETLRKEELERQAQMEEAQRQALVQEERERQARLEELQRQALVQEERERQAREVQRQARLEEAQRQALVQEERERQAQIEEAQRQAQMEEVPLDSPIGADPQLDQFVGPTGAEGDQPSQPSHLSRACGWISRKIGSVARAPGRLGGWIKSKIGNCFSALRNRYGRSPNPQQQVHDPYVTYHNGNQGPPSFAAWRN